jgi:hypothetical protein
VIDKIARKAHLKYAICVEAYWRRYPLVQLERDIDMMNLNDAETVSEVQIAPRTRGRPKTVDVGSRLHLSIPESLTKRLQEIQKQTHASSITDVVRSALQLYAAAVEEHQNGGHIYFKRKDESGERQLALFI